ncbi:MAG: ATP-binding protein [Defluviitaleaceae bacterium]|nr:ATP-binding protein [Defluviitaleaceae bacterium]MCL2238988.1 ATP-binding protein [Defluviitaleaceae bacterium]
MSPRYTIFAIFCFMGLALVIFTTITVLTRIETEPVYDTARLETFDLSSRVARLQLEAFDAFPRALLTPADFAQGVHRVPVRPNQELYATYRLLLPLEPGVIYGLSGYSALHAMAIWVDGVLRYCVGVPADSLEAMTARTSHFTLFFVAAQGYTEIVIQRSSFVHARGGSLNPLFLGEQTLITNINRRTLVNINIMLGIIAISFLYFVGMYLIFNNRKRCLYAALICLMMVLRTLIREHVLITTFFPEISWETVHRLSYLSTNGFIIFAILFMNAMFMRNVGKKRRGFNRVFLVPAIGYFIAQSILVLTTPTPFYTQFLVFFNIMFTVISVSMLGNTVWIIIKFPAMRSVEHILVFIASTTSVFFGAMESLHFVFNPTLMGVNYLQFGTLAFIVINAAALGIHFVQTQAELVAERNRASVALAAKNAKSEFLAKMSHEIRTPMNAILGMTELILREKLSNKVHDQATIIYKSGGYLLSIINNILDLTKIETGHMVIIKFPYRFLNMVEYVTQIIQLRLKDSKVKFSADIDKNIPPVLVGDEVKLQQILINLLDNAVKYTRDGGITLTITGTPSEAGVCVLHIQVKDSGIGIDADNLDRVYDIFTQFDLEKNHNVEGTGLGLAITRSLIQLMDGTIQVESEYGLGSAFLITLPQEIGESEAIPEIDAPTIFTAPEAHVLAVDDVEINLTVVETMLEHFKIKTTLCQSGEEAVKAAQANHFDLILMDHMMPAMNGTETMRAIRALEGKQKIPIVVLTANAIAGSKEMFLKSGFDDYLSKPVDIAQLSSALAKWLPEGKIKEKGERGKI